MESTTRHISYLYLPLLKPRMQGGWLAAVSLELEKCRLRRVQVCKDPYLLALQSFKNFLQFERGNEVVRPYR